MVFLGSCLVLSPLIFSYAFLQTCFVACHILIVCWDSIFELKAIVSIKGFCMFTNFACFCLFSFIIKVILSNRNMCFKCVVELDVGTPSPRFT
jgi:hypothetical protein